MKIPYNYCVTCHEKPQKDSHWCVNHKGRATVYCSNCGALLNALLDHNKTHERQLCTGCKFAFAHEPTPVNSYAKTYMETAIANKNLPIHVAQAYRRHLAQGN